MVKMHQSKEILYFIYTFSTAIGFTPVAIFNAKVQLPRLGSRPPPILVGILLVLFISLGINICAFSIIW